MTRVLVLGAGFGGLEIASRLSDALGDEADVVLLDRADAFVFGFSKLDVAFGRATSDEVRHLYRDLVRPGVRFVQAEILAIDAAAHRVETDQGTFEAEVLVVALGADLRLDETPGLVEGGHELYTVEGAFALREVLEQFPGGRVVVGVTSTPFKCPPAPSETALLMHDLLVRRGLREASSITLVMPLGAPIPPSPAASADLLRRFAEAGIEWRPGTAVVGLDPERRVALTSRDDELPYDLFLGIPVHRAPEVVVAAGLTVDGWIPVDRTLATRVPGVYAVGDVTSVGTPKAGVFAEGQGAIAADRILAHLRGEDTDAAYGGRGICYVEVGDGKVGRVDVTFAAGQSPFGSYDEASLAYAADKEVFGSSRVERWFGRSVTTS